MEFTKRSIELISSPIGIATVLMVFGIVLSAVKEQSRAGRRLLTCGSLLFLVLLFSPLAPYLIWNLERQYPPLQTPPAEPKVDRIVVLSGYAEEAPGIPVTSSVSEQTLANLSEGLRLFRLAPGAKLIVSGGVATKGQRPLAAIMADFLQQMGVPKEDLIVEGNSQNTYENLFEVRKLLGSAPFMLVASGCDMRRAAAVAKKLRMNPVPAPAYLWTLQRCPRTWTLADWASNYFKQRGYISLKNLYRLQWACHEYLGYIWYRLLGRL